MQQLSSTITVQLLLRSHIPYATATAAGSSIPSPEGHKQKHRDIIIFFSNITACIQVEPRFSPLPRTHVRRAALVVSLVFIFFFLSTSDSRPSLCTYCTTHSFVGIFSFAARDGIIPACLHLTLEVMTEEIAVGTSWHVWCPWPRWSWAESRGLSGVVLNRAVLCGLP